MSRKNDQKMKDSVMFNNGDLFYGIHRADVYLTGDKQSNNKWKLTVTVTDRFNFGSLWSLNTGLGGIANNLGWAMQWTGMGYDYEWTVTFSKVY